MCDKWGKTKMGDVKDVRSVHGKKYKGKKIAGEPGQIMG
jgi:hypothetical protein